MRALRIVTASLLIVTLLVGAWAGVYAYNKGFSKKWRRLIMEEFDRHGIEAQIGKLTIDPFAGLVARDVKIFADPEHRSVLASMDNITLDIDFAKLLRKQQFLNTVEFRDADIAFPIDPDRPDDEHVEIRDFSARVRLPENRIEIDHAECDFHGVRLSLAGSLLQPKPAAGDDETDWDHQLELMKKRRAFLARLVEEIGQFQIDKKAPPHLHIELIGDLDAPETIEATAGLTATSLGRNGYYCNEFEVRAEYRHPDILIDQIKIVDDIGELYGEASWRIGDRVLPFGVESSIDSHTLLRSIFGNSTLREVVFYSPPRLGASGEIYLDGVDPDVGTGLPLKLSGTFECENFKVSGGHIFEGAYAEFSIDPKRWYVRNLSLDDRTGSATLNALYDSEAGIRYRGEIDMDPTAFQPIVRTEQTRDFLRRFRFDKKNPVVSLSVEGSGPGLDPREWRTTGEFTLGPCAYREIPLLAATGRFEAKGKEMFFRNFRIVRQEGHIDGDFVHVNGHEQLVEVKGIRSTAYPHLAAAYFAPKTAEFLGRYRFLQPPEVTLDGTIDTSKPSKFRSDLEATFRTSGPASFGLFKRELAITAPEGMIAVKGDTLVVSLTTGLLGGNATYSGTSGLGPRKGNFAGELDAKAIDFGQLVELYEIPTETRGTLDGRLTFDVPADDRERWSGTGGARLSEGNVFAIPVMGPLSRIVSGVLDRPQAGYSVANEASATFAIDRGVIRSDDFTALTPGFVLRARGEIDTVEDTLDIDAEMNARGALRLVGWPLSKLLRYKGEGDLSDPRWRPVNFTLPRGEGDGQGERRITDMVTGVPKATVGAGSKVLETGARATVGVGEKAIGTGAKVIGAGARGAMEVGSKARDLIPIPRLIPKRGDKSEEVEPEVRPALPLEEEDE